MDHAALSCCQPGCVRGRGLRAGWQGPSAELELCTCAGPCCRSQDTCGPSTATRTNFWQPLHSDSAALAGQPLSQHDQRLPAVHAVREPLGSPAACPAGGPERLGEWQRLHAVLQRLDPGCHAGAGCSHRYGLASKSLPRSGIFNSHYSMFSALCKPCGRAQTGSRALQICHVCGQPCTAYHRMPCPRLPAGHPVICCTGLATGVTELHHHMSPHLWARSVDPVQSLHVCSSCAPIVSPRKKCSS